MDQAIKALRGDLKDQSRNHVYIKELLKQKFVGTQHEWESHIGNIFSIFDKNIKNYRPKNLLDVGCGNGDRTIRIADYFKVSIDNTYGIDCEKQYVTESRQRFTAAEIDLELDGLPFNENYFDLVMCNQVLEHLKEYKKVIEDIIRVTRRDGYIVLGIPNLAHLINRIYFLTGAQPMCISLDGQHVRGFTHKAFIEALSYYENVELIDCKGALMYPLPFSISKFLAKYFIGLSGYVCYLLKKKN